LIFKHSAAFAKRTRNYRRFESFKMSTVSFELEGDGDENPFAGNDEATEYAFTPFQDVK
jgi:hypothetical protein